eukprot:scaffold281749_cov40-Tisochrysis_lutea.AAC.1
MPSASAANRHSETSPASSPDATRPGPAQRTAELPEAVETVMLRLGSDESGPGRSRRIEPPQSSPVSIDVATATTPSSETERAST